MTGSATAFVAYYRLNNNIVSQDVSGFLDDKDRPAKVAEDDNAENILIIGSDARSGLAATNVSGQRSDTTILLHLPADRESATLVSIPRDSWVELPRCKREDGSTVPPSTQRFNTAYSQGGTACTIRTVEKLTNVRIDHHVVLNFRGFRHMVDAVNGVEICLPEDVDDPKSHLSLSAGRHTVNGRQALAYVRTRHGLGDGSDLSRIDRQQAFLSSLVSKVSGNGLLFRPDRLFGFLDAATKSIATDPDLADLFRLRKLAQSVRGVDTRNVNFVTVPNEPNPDDPNTVVWKPSANALWSAIRYDRPLPGQEKKPGPTTSPTSDPSASATDEPLKTPPENIRVTVLNGSGVPGAASKAAADLEAAGFVVTAVGDADRDDFRTTTVSHDPAYDESGRTLAAALPGSEVEQDPTLGSNLVVVVGSDDVQVSPVEVSGSTASPQPEESLKTRSADQDICS
ncbi:MAG: LCP family protein [Actinomycetes bacterium]